MSDACGANQWHADTETLRHWIDGVAGPTVSVAVEQHLLHCADCQAEVAACVPATPLRQVWENVLAEVEVPRAGRVERTLVRLGLSPSAALLVSSTLALRLEWLAGVIVVLSFAVIAATLGPVGGIAVFLVIAPLVPVVGVAAAYGPSADPLYELVLTSPYAMVRLVLLRTAAVLVTSAPLTVVAGLLLPTSPTVAVAWLLPAAGFIAVVLTASIWLDPELAAGAIGLSWAAAVTVAVRLDDPLAVFGPAALIGYVGVAVVAVLILLQHLLGAVPSWRLR